MHFDFIEVGTSDFHTCIEKATDSTRGISIEPVKVYLDALPDKKNVVKLTCAIGHTNERSLATVYYMPPSKIKELNLSYWFKGLNTIGYIHPTIKRHGFDWAVISEQVPSIPLKDIITEYNVTELDLLKLDLEGSDCKVLLNFLPFAEETNFRPKKILFENNSLTDQEEYNLVEKKLTNMGYVFSSDISDETTFVLAEGKGQN